MDELKQLLRETSNYDHVAPFIYKADEWRGRADALRVVSERDARQIRRIKLLVDVSPVLRKFTDEDLADLLRMNRVALRDDRLVPVVSGASEAGLYSVTASAITTGTALKTLLEVISGANVAPTVFQWWCEFNGSAAAAAILIELLRATAGFTGGTAVTPTLLQPGRKAVQSTCNSGIAAAVNTTEGTRGSLIEQHYVPPTSGILLQYPLSREPEMAISDRIRISATAAAAVNAAMGMAFSE